MKILRGNTINRTRRTDRRILKGLKWWLENLKSVTYRPEEGEIARIRVSGKKEDAD